MGLLFSFGTLRQPDVQVAVFGHTLEGQPEQLPGFRLTTVAITDPEVVRISGSAQHPMLERSGTRSDVVQGVVFDVTEEELAAADAYEDDCYARSAVRRLTGRQAWVYLPVDDTGAG